MYPLVPDPHPTQVVVTFTNLSSFPASLFWNNRRSCVSLSLINPIFGKGDTIEINSFLGDTFYWILIGSYEMLGTDEVIVSNKRIYELPSDTKRIGNSIERWLHRIHTDLLHRPKVQTLEDLGKNLESYGPAAVYCLVTNEEGSAEHVYSHSFNDFPKSNAAAVPIRSISKLVTAVTVLRLGDLATREDKEDVLRHLSKETRTTLSNILDTKLSTVFPSCETSTLGSATVSEMLTMQTALDNRLNAAWKFLRKMPDHAAFPPYCDVKGLSPVECVELVICPAYPALQQQQQQSLSTDIGTSLENSLPDELATAASAVRIATCHDENKNCLNWAAGGECEKNPSYMFDKCRRSCNTCIPPSYHTSSCITGDAESCFKDEFNNTNYDKNINYFRRGWFLYQDGDDDQNDKNDNDSSSPYIEYKLNLSTCNYDNYSYTLIDAMIMRLTKRPVWEWTLEIVAETIGMTDMIRCTKVGGKDCYGHSRSLEEMLDPQKWPEWTGGLESRNWSGSTYVASARDLANLGIVLLKNWKRMGDDNDDSTFLSESFINKLMEVGPHWNVNNEHMKSWACQGLDAFGYGLGYCSQARAIPVKQHCSAAQWYGWGSTYGSRFMFMPIANGGGVSCATNFNQATKPSNLIKGRMSSRQHTYSHEQAKQIRMLFPESE